MVVRVYVSGISGNKEVKKRQQRVTMILESKNIEYTVIDITEPGKENEKEFMQENSKARDSKHPLPPQIFNDDHYCGDYENFDMANELDELEKFLNVSESNANNAVIENGINNGSKLDNEDTIKKDVRESTEDIVDTVNSIESEAVSVGNEIDPSVPEEIESNVPGERHPSMPEEIESNVPDESHPNDSDDPSQTLEKIPQDEIVKDSVEHGSLEITDNSEKIIEDESSSDIADEE